MSQQTVDIAFFLYYISCHAVCLYQIVKDFYTIVNYFIDKRMKARYNRSMEFTIKPFETQIDVTGIVNVHFFEFSEHFTTQNDKHPFCELVFVSAGVLEVRSETFSGILKKGEMIVHGANELHSLSCPTGSNPTVIIVGFECESKSLAELSKRPLPLSDASVKRLAEIVKEGRNVFAPPYDVPAYDMKTRKKQPFGATQLLKILLEYFFLQLTRERRAHVDETTEKPAFMTGEIIAYVSENYLEKITLDELAFLFKTNRATLCKEFKRATGRTVGEFISDKRLEKAKKMIEETDETFTQIADELNFDSIHYFTRFFKKQTGLTPKEYRAKRK